MLDFPASPVNGQVFRPGNGVANYVYRSADPAWTKRSGTALPFNRIVNPAMLVSQQNGDDASLWSAVANWYSADQWYASWKIDVAAGNIRSGRTRSSPLGNDYLWATSSVGSAAMLADGWFLFTQIIEGSRVSDFRWGTSAAKQAILRFSAYCNVLPGTYVVGIRNGAFDRSYLVPFVISAAATWQTYELVIPGDVTGTWPVDESAGLRIAFCFGAGSNYIGVEGWQAGSKLGLPGMTNAAAADADASVRIADVGLYLDPYNTGVAPPFIVPNIDEVIAECQRYWYRMYFARGIVQSATAIRVSTVHPVPMRVVPVVGIVGAPRLYDYSVAPTVTSLGPGGTEWEMYMTASASAGGMTIGRPGALIYDNDDAYIAVSARM